MNDNDYSILIGIAENSGRETFITNADFKTLWTNSEKSIQDILIYADRNSLHGVPEHETYISLFDGNVLKITPIFSADSKIKYYFIEIFENNELLKMFSMSSAFKKYVDHFFDMRKEIIDLISVTSAADLGYKGSDLTEFLPSISNKAALFAILTSDSRPPCSDITGPLLRLCGRFQKMMAGNGMYEINLNIMKNLFCKADIAGLDFAVANLITNAILYCDSEKKIIDISAQRSEDNILIEVSDNGISADIEKIAKFRQVYNDNDRNDTEGLGISVAELFADTCGGKLELENSSSGGLTARIILPFYDPNKNMTLYSPSSLTIREDITGDIMLKVLTKIRCNRYVISDEK